MILIITGGRDFEDTEFAYKVLDEINSKTKVRLLIHGGCEVWDRDCKAYRKAGADWIGNDWAAERKIRIIVRSGIPYFKKYGKVGFLMRNELMAECALSIQQGYKFAHSLITIPIKCVAFKGGSGTKHMCEAAATRGIEVMRTWEYK
jgi:hypothetical protein